MSAPEGVEKLVRELCPGCDRHLADTWDDDAGECACCGFAYVRWANPDSRDEPVAPSVRELLVRRFAAVGGFVCAIFSGIVMAGSEFAVETAGGAIVVNGPDSAFWAAGAMGFVGLLAITLAIGGGGR